MSVYTRNRAPSQLWTQGYRCTFPGSLGPEHADRQRPSAPDWRKESLDLMDAPTTLCPSSGHPGDRAQFTLIELLVVIAIIGLLAAMLLPVLRRAKEKAHESSCTNQLNQFGKAFTMYWDENEEEPVPWISTLYGDFITTDELYMCPSDDNEPATPDDEWLARPWGAMHNGKKGKYNEAYDREGNHQNPDHADELMDRNEDIKKCSYFYEYTHAKCTVPGWTNSFISWRHAKLDQLYNEVHTDERPPGWPPTDFPIVRCYWHLRKDKTSQFEAAPVLNVAQNGNFLLTKADWEKGQWTPR